MKLNTKLLRPERILDIINDLRCDNLPHTAQIIALLEEELIEATKGIRIRAGVEKPEG